MVDGMRKNPQPRSLLSLTFRARVPAQRKFKIPISYFFRLYSKKLDYGFNLLKELRFATDFYIEHFIEFSTSLRLLFLVILKPSFPKVKPVRHPSIRMNTITLSCR